MAVNRGISSQPAVDAADQLGFVGPVVLPTQRQRARVLVDRSLEVWHAGEPVSAGNAVNLSIPRAAAKAVIQPFDGRARQSRLLAAQEVHHLSLKLAVITRVVERSGAGGRIELAVETPQKLLYRIFSVDQ